MTQISDDEDASDIVFDSEDDDEEETPKKKQKKKDDITSLFASAEEFASLLEDEGSSNRAPGSSNTWANKDNASMLNTLSFLIQICFLIVYFRHETNCLGRKTKSMG